MFHELLGVDALMSSLSCSWIIYHHVESFIITVSSFFVDQVSSVVGEPSAAAAMNVEHEVQLLVQEINRLGQKS